MQWMANLRMVYKLGTLIFIAVIALAIVGGIGYYNQQEQTQDLDSLYKDRLIPIKLIDEARTNIRASNGAVLELMLTVDAKKNQELKAFIDERSKKSSEILTEIEKTNLDGKARELLSAVNQSRQKYRDTRTKVIELALENKNAEAYALYSHSLDPIANEYITNLRELSNYYSTLAEQSNVSNKEHAEKAVITSLVVMVVALLILVFSGIFITKSITGPVSVMVAVCAELAAGDFRDKPRKLLRKDEIGKLADALAQMRDMLRSLMKQVSHSAEQLAAASEELTASAEQSAQAANQVAVSITDVAKGAEEQLHAANDTSAVVEQMSASSEQIAATTSGVAAQSAQAAAKATSGNQAVEKAVAQMIQIENTVNTSAKVITELGERSKEIGQIVDTISGIAGQTNLLALNAAIEAARAGEQGRGFAVVAEEVRKLAEQSQEAAKQISGLIAHIQGDTEKAVAAMDHGTREVKHGAEVVNASGQAFREIVSLINQVSDQVKEISAAIEQTAIGSQQIVGSVQRIDQLSKRVSGEAQTVSAATEEQSASMEEVASSSQSLAKLAQDLQTAVSKFQM